ncbi:uncharacterized protein si:ch211-227n13.3 [Carcharodon carcharias]|uniref:uncharacterized protein si:ch211-227n13.3 n=1 Tax=Carcharodon carcharias TaxID=13397 RepID=UPI001B7E291F|nr:uncharacterized protein si:ch211-227n13.3 [Carcharodon carcharias]
MRRRRRRQEQQQQQQQQNGGPEDKACTSRPNNTLNQVEVETAFQQLYNSLLGNKEKVEKSAPKDNHCAHTTTQKDLYNLLALENVPQNNLKNASRDVLITEDSIPSEQLRLRNSDSGRAITSTCSAEAARLSAKRPNLKCNTFPGKAKANLKSNTETSFFAVKQPVLQEAGLSPKNSDKNEEGIFEFSSNDDAISTNSGEDYRETVTCEACSEMFWKVVNKKATKKKGCASGKKQPYDPTSLSCDQWVLKKPLLPRNHLQKHRRAIWCLKKPIGASAQSEVTRKWIPRCSRPHVFLQRNLRSSRRKVDEFLAKHRKKQPQKKTKKRSRKKELFVFKLPKTPASSIVISDNEDSEMEISTVKRKLTTAVLSREDRTKKGSCDFSADDSNTCESGFYSSDSKSVQCESSTCTNPAYDSRSLNFNPGKTEPAFSSSASPCPENQLHSPNGKAKTWEGTQSKINSRIAPPSSFDWLKPGGFTYMIAKLKARSLTSSGSVVKET